MSRSTATPSQPDLLPKTKKVSPLAASQADEKRRRDKMLGLLRKIAPDDLLVAFAVESVLLLPGVEDLSDWPPHRAPKTVGEMKALEVRVRKWLAIKGKVPLDGSTTA